jgi:hypothetical protein
MDDPLLLRRRTRGWIAHHDLTVGAAADYFGVSRQMLIDFLAGERTPWESTGSRIEQKLSTVPPAELPRRHNKQHEAAIRDRWGRMTTDEIGREIGLSGRRVRQIAARLDLAGPSLARPRDEQGRFLPRHSADGDNLSTGGK